jgi:hypothetical protein
MEQCVASSARLPDGCSSIIIAPSVRWWLALSCLVVLCCVAPARCVRARKLRRKLVGDRGCCWWPALLPRRLSDFPFFPFFSRPQFHRPAARRTAVDTAHTQRRSALRFMLDTAHTLSAPPSPTATAAATARTVRPAASPVQRHCQSSASPPPLHVAHSLTQSLHSLIVYAPLYECSRHAATSSPPPWTVTATATATRHNRTAT